MSSSRPTTKIRHPFLQVPLGPQEELYQILRARLLGVGHCIDWAALEQIQLADAVRALLTTDPWGLFFKIVKSTYIKFTLELYSTFHLQTVMTNFDDPGTVQFRLGGLVCQLSIPEFRIAMGLYTKEFMDDNDLDTLHRHIYYSPLKCWRDLVPASATYVPSRAKASALSPSLSTANEYVINLAYFIAFTICHQAEQHRRGVISIGPYVTQLAWHFGLLNIAAQSSSLTLIGQMSPQGISSMLSMRMIEKRRDTYPPQYRLAQSTEEEDLRTLLMMSLHVTRIHRLSHHPPLVQFMRRLHTLTSLSALLDSSNIIKSSKAHHRIGTKNSTEKGSLRLSCPAQPRP
ncbi:hypothetical protein GOBAR_AA31694 [Gossypium barbadense]|uniref:Uncharacterized protein n=1 Tax=Gossypium barbadense TaxID=3634 RepID=A0A2P5WD32_GOSBA|nr:hypothetical protein GOBAR_AA31694 [Gossypium barbadense]